MLLYQVPGIHYVPGIYLYSRTKTWNVSNFFLTKEIWGLWAGTESLACLIRRDGEAGHNVGNNYHGCSW